MRLAVNSIVSANNNDADGITINNTGLGIGKSPDALQGQLQIKTDGPRNGIVLFGSPETVGNISAIWQDNYELRLGVNSQNLSGIAIGQDGNVRFDGSVQNLRLDALSESRPACDASRRGTLWFSRSSTQYKTDGEDILAVCMARGDNCSPQLNPEQWRKVRITDLSRRQVEWKWQKGSSCRLGGNERGVICDDGWIDEPNGPPSDYQEYFFNCNLFYRWKNIARYSD